MNPLAALIAVLLLAAQARAATDALTELNRDRARKGLSPFLLDEGLLAGAQRVADERARQHCRFHLEGFDRFGRRCTLDHTYLPAEVDRGFAVGGAGMASNYFNACFAAYPQSLPGEEMHGGIPGSGPVYAGAAVAYDNQGQRYCQLFVSRRPSGFHLFSIIRERVPCPPIEVSATAARTPARGNPTGLVYADAPSFEQPRRRLFRWRRGR